MGGAISRLSGVLAVLCAAVSISPSQVFGGQSVPVPRVVIYAGAIIEASALEERDIQLGRAPEQSWHMSRTSLVGKVARRTLLPGRAIPILSVKEPDLVKAGKPVVLVFVAGQLTITGSGIALQAGAVNDRISAQNTESGALVKGVVASDGSLRVGD